MMSAGNHTPEIPLLLDPATFTTSSRIILGSRSPRRRDLLSAAAGAERIVCLPPISSAEAGFLNLRHDADIQERLLQITHAKHQDVSAQISSQPSLNLHCPPVVVVADTTVVAGPQDGHREVLGQPDPTLQGARRTRLVSAAPLRKNSPGPHRRAGLTRKSAAVTDCHHRSGISAAHRTPGRLVSGHR